jgi:hypothetical protein
MTLFVTGLILGGIAGFAVCMLITALCGDDNGDSM